MVSGTLFGILSTSVDGIYTNAFEVTIIYGWS